MGVFHELGALRLPLKLSPVRRLTKSSQRNKKMHGSRAWHPLRLPLSSNPLVARNLPGKMVSYDLPVQGARVEVKVPNSGFVRNSMARR